MLCEGILIILYNYESNLVLTLMSITIAVSNWPVAGPSVNQLIPTH